MSPSEELGTLQHHHHQHHNHHHCNHCHHHKHHDQVSLPWLKPVASLLTSYSTTCTHQGIIVNTINIIVVIVIVIVIVIIITHMFKIVDFEQCSRSS